MLILFKGVTIFNVMTQSHLIYLTRFDFTPVQCLVNWYSV